MEPRITLITLGVSDLDAARRFYREGLGLPLREGFEEIAFFSTAGTLLALFPREKLAADANVDSGGSGFRGFALGHGVMQRASAGTVGPDRRNRWRVRTLPMRPR